MNNRIEEIRARYMDFELSNENYTKIFPKYIEPVLKHDGHGQLWSHFAAYAKEDIPYLLDKIERLQDAQRWIPVTEKTPEHKGFVLAITDNGTCEPIVAWMRGDNVWFANGFCIVNNVTHWMPLPAPPNAVKQKNNTK